MVKYIKQFLQKIKDACQFLLKIATIPVKRSLLTSDDRTVCRKKPIKIYRQVGKLEVLIMLKVRVKMFSCSRVPLFGTHKLQPMRLFCPWNSPGKNTGLGCHSLLQGIFLTQGLNLGLRHCTQILNQLSHQGIPTDLKGCSLKSQTEKIIKGFLSQDS